MPTTIRPASILKGIVGFCLCPRTEGQVRNFGPGRLRVNVLTDAADINNDARRCLACGSKFSAIGC